MPEFRFENTLQLTESQYLAVWAMMPTGRRSRIVRFGVLVAIAVAFLLTKYTLLLGLILLALAVLALFVPRLLPVGIRSTFRGHRYLEEALTYGVDDERLWVKGARIDASVPWSMLVSWREKDDWLVLSPSGIPPVYLSLARLKNEGLYGRVRALAASNAPEYKSSRRNPFFYV